MSKALRDLDREHEKVNAMAEEVEREVYTVREQVTVYLIAVAFWSTVVGIVYLIH